MPEMANTMPDKIFAGTTVKMTLGYGDYPAATWSAKLYMAGISVLAPVSGVPNGNDFDFTISAANTKQLKAGTYKWRVVCQSGADVFVADSGVVTIEQDLEQAGETDAQSFAERALALVEARLLNRYVEDMESFQIAGRAVSQIPHNELLEVRDRLLEEIRMSKAGNQFMRDVRVVFSGVRHEL